MCVDAGGSSARGRVLQSLACQPCSWSRAEPASSVRIWPSGCCAITRRPASGSSTTSRPAGWRTCRSRAAAGRAPGDRARGHSRPRHRRAGGGRRRHHLPPGRHALGAALGRRPAGRQRPQRHRHAATCWRRRAGPACRGWCTPRRRRCTATGPSCPSARTSPRRPISPYAVSKATGELYAAVWRRLYGVETVGLRYFNVFGPRQDPKREYAAVIPRFILWGLAGTPLEVHGDGHAVARLHLHRQRRGGQLPGRRGAAASPGRSSTWAAATG